VRAQREPPGQRVDEERPRLDPGRLRDARQVAHREHGARLLAPRADAAALADAAERAEPDPLAVAAAPLAHAGQPEAPLAGGVAHLVAPDRVRRRAEQLRHGRQRPIGVHQLAPVVARRREGEEERVGAAVRELELHVAPVLVGVVVHERPALEHRPAAGVEHHAVRRAPHRRLGHVRQRHRAARGPEHVEAAAGPRRLRRERVERRAEARGVRGIGRAHRAHVARRYAHEARVVGPQHEARARRRPRRVRLVGAPVARLRVGRARARALHVDEPPGERRRARAHDHARPFQPRQQLAVRDGRVRVGRQPRERPRHAAADAAVERDGAQRIGRVPGGQHDERRQRVVQVARRHRQRRAPAAAHEAGPLEVADPRLVEANARQRQDVGSGGGRTRLGAPGAEHEEPGREQTCGVAHGEPPSDADSARAREFPARSGRDAVDRVQCPAIV